MKFAYLVVAFFGFLVLTRGEIGCSNLPAVPPSVDTAGRCILDVVGKDLLGGMSYEAAVLDAAVRCLGSGSDANKQAVQNLWAAHKAAEFREKDAGIE